MATKGESPFASVRWLGVYPAANNAVPTWSADGTSCTLPIKLEPDVTYAVTLNSSRQRPLADTNGVTALACTWVFATGARAATDFPPHVVSSDPPPGAADVDPQKAEISVTFDRPVAPGDFSWVILRGSGQYPGTREGGPPRLSADRLTATIDARLAPGTVYALSVNDLSYIGYKDHAGPPGRALRLALQYRRSSRRRRCGSGGVRHEVRRHLPPSPALCYHAADERRAATD